MKTLFCKLLKINVLKNHKKPFRKRLFKLLILNKLSQHKNVYVIENQLVITIY